MVSIPSYLTAATVAHQPGRPSYLTAATLHTSQGVKVSKSQTRTWATQPAVPTNIPAGCARSSHQAGSYQAGQGLADASCELSPLAPEPAGPQPAKPLLPPLLGALAARLVLVHARQLKRVRVIHALRGRQPRRRRRVLCRVLYHRAELTRLLSQWSFASKDDAGPNMVTMYLKTWLNMVT